MKRNEYTRNVAEKQERGRRWGRGMGAYNHRFIGGACLLRLRAPIGPGGGKTGRCRLPSSRGEGAARALYRRFGGRFEERERLSLPLVRRRAGNDSSESSVVRK